MSRERYDHLHTYKAVSKHRKMYRCTKEGCPHSINAVAMTGRKAECATCGKEVTITEDHLRRQTIACIGCGFAVGKPRTSLTSVELIKSIESGEAQPFDVAALMKRVKT